MRLAPDQSQTLAGAIKAVDQAGYNAINFLEFTFVPTLEAPDHAHADFQKTMRWYYPFLPRSLHRVNGWKKQAQPVDLVTNSGHTVHFPQQFIYPLPFRMRHYQFLSIGHAIQKYAHRRHPAEALLRGMHGWREQLEPASVRLPAQAELHELGDDGWLNIANPRAREFLDNRVEYGARSGPAAKSIDEYVRKLKRLPWLRPIKRWLRQQFDPVRYYGGVYAFAAEPPFAPNFIRPTPILWPDRERPRQRPTASNTAQAIAAVDHFLDVFPDAGIFLCTDDGAVIPHSGRQARREGVQEIFRKRYGGRVVWTTPRSLDRRTTVAIQDAVVDLWLLRATDLVVGTQGSSFSEMAVFGLEIPHQLVAGATPRYQRLEDWARRFGIYDRLIQHGRRHIGSDAPFPALLWYFALALYRWARRIVRRQL